MPAKILEVPIIEAGTQTTIKILIDSHVQVSVAMVSKGEMTKLGGT
jgi:hypothetical protein